MVRKRIVRIPLMCTVPTCKPCLPSAYESEKQAPAALVGDMSMSFTFVATHSSTLQDDTASVLFPLNCSASVLIDTCLTL